MTPWPGMDWWHVMAELLFSPALWWGIGAGSAAFAALAVFHKRLSPLWAALSALCMAGGVLLALFQRIKEIQKGEEDDAKSY